MDQTLALSKHSIIHIATVASKNWCHLSTIIAIIVNFRIFVRAYRGRKADISVSKAISNIIK